MKVVLLGCILIFTQYANSQADASLLNKIEAALQTGTTPVSSILTDKKYLSLHPETPFRELIRKYAVAAVLKIAATGEPGKKIRVLGTIKNENGQAVAGALVYLYQTDAKGWYAADAPHVLMNEGDMRHARLFGYVLTDKDGRFELHTVKPSGYPKSDLPAHIHVHVMAEGYRPYINEFLFDDDERLTGTTREQSIRNRFLIAKPENTTAPFEQQFSYSISLQK